MFIQIISMQIDDRRLYSRFEGSQFPCQRHRSHHSLTPTNNQLTPPSQSRGHLPLLWIKKTPQYHAALWLSTFDSFADTFECKNIICQFTTNVNNSDSLLCFHTVRLRVDTEIPSKRPCQSTIFWGGVSRYTATPMTVSLYPGHSDITRFRPYSPIAKWNHLDHNKKIPKVAQTTGTFDVFDPRSGISGPTLRRASACSNLHELWTQPAHVRCPVAQLLI